jgi:hypothetical protein
MRFKDLEKEQALKRVNEEDKDRQISERKAKSKL